MDDDEIRKTVFQALDNAVANDHIRTARYWAAELLAWDLASSCEALEGLSSTILVPHILAWRKEHP